MASDIDIINSALSKLGAVTITAITDPSVEGRLANRTYADIRDAFLREFPWNFAVKRAELAADPIAPAWGFDFRYNLPSDSLRLIEVSNRLDLEWRNESNSIVTNMEAPLQIIYLGSATVDEMDFTFREALAARLAMEWAETITQTTSTSQQMASLYNNKLRVARTADGQEDRIRRVESNDFITSRFGNTSFTGSGVR